MSDRSWPRSASLATVIGLALLASILFTLLSRGIGGLSLGVLYTNTAPAGSNGGLANAIVGSLLQTAWAR